MFNSRLLQTLCSIVLVAFTGTFAVPIGATAMAAKLAQVPVTPAAAPSAADHYGAAVAALKQWLANPDADAAQNSGLGTDTKGLIQKLAGNGDSPRLRALRQHRDDLEAAKADVDADMSAMEQKLIAHKLPAIILNRQHTAVATIQARHTKLQQMIAAVEQHEEKLALGKAAKATGKTAGSPHAQLASYLSALNPERRSIKTDPKHLPFHFGKHDKLPTDPTIAFAHSMMTAKADGKIPTSTPDIHDPIYLPNGRSVPGKRGAPLPKTANKLALRGGGGGLLGGAMLAVSASSTAATDPNLAATEDVQFTPAIQALATQLNHNPVTIYNWVYNNIEFVPTYGSIQGSDMTLQTLKGNAYDIASLLIALYRVSGIPARYAYGLVDLPAANVENWVGGVNVPEAAQQLLGQGGVPNIGVVSGGQITKIRMEHVWVEAEVDYYPSRGAVNRNPDTWVPVDAAYKQYTYTQGMDFKNQIPLDVQTIQAQLQKTTTINLTENWVIGVPSSAMQTPLQSYQAQLQAYVDANDANPTTADLIGGKSIIGKRFVGLAGTLPYDVYQSGGRFSDVPDAFRHLYQEVLYDSAGRIMFSYIASLPSLAGKKIVLNFVPATTADQAEINGLLPKPGASGTAISPDELPDSMPGYLILMKAQLLVGGVIVAESHPGVLDGDILQTKPFFEMGSVLTLSQGVFSPDRNWEYAADSSPIAGETYVTAIDGEGVSDQQMGGLEKKMQAAAANLAALNTLGLDTNDFNTDILYRVMLGYFYINDADQQTASKIENVVEFRRPSFGNYFVRSSVHWFFGFPVTVTSSGLTMDTGFITSIVSDRYNNIGDITAYNSRASATYSAYESVVPAAALSYPGHSVNPVSTISVLEAAASAGVKTYMVNSSNVGSVLASLPLQQDVKDDISNAIASGQEAMVPGGLVTIGNWTGTGYVILDPATGGSAYKISGGQNGSDDNDGYWARYFAFINNNAITFDDPAFLGLLSLLPAPKSLFGFRALLGSSNSYTTVIRGVAMMLFRDGIIESSEVAIAALAGRLLWPIAFFIGIYNFTILLEGFIYAIAFSEPKDPRYRRKPYCCLHCVLFG